MDEVIGYILLTVLALMIPAYIGFTVMCGHRVFVWLTERNEPVVDVAQERRLSRLAGQRALLLEAVNLMRRHASFREDLRESIDSIVRKCEEDLP